MSEEKKLLAAIVYGESSSSNVENEMYAIASVMVRQKNARGYADIQSFVKEDPSFSFVVNDGNPRFKLLLGASIGEIEKNPGMTMAYAAAENALRNGIDKSNGAYFWDGADIKTNYKKHYKVRHGIKFSNSSHNIYSIEESLHVVVRMKVTKIKVNGKVTEHREEVARADHTYESTAAYGGTIFWRISPEYIKAVAGAKEYR